MCGDRMLDDDMSATSCGRGFSLALGGMLGAALCGPHASPHRICAHTAAMVGAKAGPVFAVYFSSRQAKPQHPCPWQANRGPLGATTYQDYKA
jgi:hypothetical protein